MLKKGPVIGTSIVVTTIVGVATIIGTIIIWLIAAYYLFWGLYIVMMLCLTLLV